MKKLVNLLTTLVRNSNEIYDPNFLNTDTKVERLLYAIGHSKNQCLSRKKKITSDSGSRE